MSLSRKGTTVKMKIGNDHSRQELCTESRKGHVQGTPSITILQITMSKGKKREREAVREKAIVKQVPGRAGGKTGNIGGEKLEGCQTLYD